MNPRFPLVSGGILKGEAMLRIVEPRLRIHEVPLENVQLVNSCVTVELDDESENRWRLRFVFATLRLTTMDCANATAIMAEMDGDICYPDGRDPDAWSRWVRFLLEKTDSPLVPQANVNLRKYDHDGRDLHHYVMAVGDNLWEIVSEPVEITKIVKSEKE
jgi:hypothetical protein